MKPDRLLSARLGTALFFLIHGLVIGTWVSRIPAIQMKLGLSQSLLGVLLLGGAIGALIAMVTSGWTLKWYGSKTTTAVSSFAFCLALGFIGLSGSIPMLGVSLVFLGMSAGLMDVSMNAQAVEVEKGYQRPLMASFHAMFSIGAVISAFLSGWIAHHGISPFLHFTVSAAVYFLLVFAGIPYLLPGGAAQRKEKIRFPKVDRVFVGLCIVGFCCYITEGAMTDWGAVYLYKVIKTSEGLAATGYAVFSATMTVGRLLGDWMTQRFGAQAIVLYGTLMAVCGYIVAITAMDSTWAFLGYALVGLGLSGIIPLVFSTAGYLTDKTGATYLSMITAFCYFSYLLGPPVVGFISDAFGLKVAFSLITVLLVLSLPFVSVFRRKAPAT